MASIVVAGDVSGTVTLTAPATAGTTTLTLPTTSGTIITTGGGAAGSFTTLTSSADASFATSSGNVGIGTASPAQKLDMNGTTARFSNGSYIGYLGAGSLLVSGAASDFTLRSDNVLSFGTGGPYERMRIDSSGRVTTPNQTAFLAQAVQADTTYSGGGTLIPFPNEVFDIGNNYDASISRFTAPVTGIYLVSWTCWNTSATTSRSALYKNGAIYKSSVNLDAISTRHNGGTDQANGVTIPVQMSSGDYIEIKVYGNAITQFWMNYFSAYLLG